MVPTIESVISRLARMNKEFLTIQEVAKVLSVSMEYVSKRRVALGFYVACRATTGKMEKPYRLTRKESVQEWIEDDQNKDALVKVWLLSLRIRRGILNGRREQRKKSKH